MKKLRKIYDIFHRTFGKYRLQIGALVAIGFISGMLEGIGANALIPLFSFITGAGEGGSDFISKSIENVFLFLNVDFGVMYLLVFIAALFVFKAIVLFGGKYVQTRIIADYENETRTELFRKTLQASWPHLLHHKIGYLEKVLFMDVKKSDAMLKSISELVLAASQVFTYLFVAFNISWSMSLITLGVGAVLFLFLSPLFFITKKIAYETGQLSRQTAHFINEIVLGLKTLKITSVSESVAESSGQYFNILRKLRIKKSIIASIPPTLLQPSSVIFILVVFAFSYKTPDFNIASFLVIIYLIQRILANINDLQIHVNGIVDAVPYIENMLQYSKELDVYREEYTGHTPFTFDHTLEFQDVSFFYNQDKEVLSDITFRIKKGEFAGLIGPSGVGKTTLVDLILRLFKPTAGVIALDRKDVSEINIDDYRGNVGYVSQDIYMMNDTIENNIKFYNPHITSEEVRRAAKDANILSFIETLPHGFETSIGERGVLLSAGQRQRISIARVLARDPELLILDEATSALDNETETQIQKVIENLRGKITVLMIAHRLSTIMNCDNILVLGDGKIVEQGNPRELLKDKDSYFYRAYNVRK